MNLESPRQNGTLKVWEKGRIAAVEECPPMARRLFVDGRVFASASPAHASRMLEHLLLNISATHPDWYVSVAMVKKHCALPLSLQKRVSELYLPPIAWLFWPFLVRSYDTVIHFDAAKSKSPLLARQRHWLSGNASTWFVELERLLEGR